MKFRLIQIAQVFVISSALLLVSSFESVHAKQETQPHTELVLADPNARQLPGFYEAEDSSAVQLTGWVIKKSKRASGLNPNAKGQYLSSFTSTHKACLRYKNASRVGIGYVMGATKGKVKVTIHDNDAAETQLQQQKFSMYDLYTDPSKTSSTPSPTWNLNDPDVDEGDFEGTNASTALTFRVFKWLWTDQTEPGAFPSGKICVSPTGNPGVGGGSEVTLDYIIVGSGPQMAIRGSGVGLSQMQASAANLLWNYSSADGGKRPPYPNNQALMATAEMLRPTNPGNWAGFVPKIPGELSAIYNLDAQGNPQPTQDTINALGEAFSATGDVPRYWILFNESDTATYWLNDEFDPTKPSNGYCLYPRPQGEYRWCQITPDADIRANNFVNNIRALKIAYQPYNKPSDWPKIIIESGSQFHAPHDTQTSWGVDPDFTVDAQGNNNNGCRPAGQEYRWGCLNRSAIWIEAFWNKVQPMLQARDLIQNIGGMGTHYYPRNDPTAVPVNEILDTTRLLKFTTQAKQWMNDKALNNKPLGNGELWLVETAIWLWPEEVRDANRPGYTYYAQSDGTACKFLGNDMTCWVRNWVGKLQDDLGKQGYVNRWAWYADRYGPKAQGENIVWCFRNGVELANTGEMTALNKTCGTFEKTPFGQNMIFAAQYR